MKASFSGHGPIPATRDSSCHRSTSTGYSSSTTTRANHSRLPVACCQWLCPQAHAPIYNFSIPAVLKAWIDMVARARVTFRHSENGPEGLLKNKQAYVMMAHGPGGTTMGSTNDFASPYLRHLLGFIGIHDVESTSAVEVRPSSSRSTSEVT